MEVVSDVELKTGGEGHSWTAGKVRLFVGITALVVALDVTTKLMVQAYLPLYNGVDVVGDYLRLTYIQNPGAAFGIHLGDYSRPVFLILSLIALAALAAMYWATPARDRIRLAAIALICGGAVGNLIDRVRSNAGVVDFLDLGIGDLRWPVFNVADIAVTTGAIFLALSLWQEDQRPRGRREGGG